MTVWESSRLSAWLYSRLAADATLQTALGGSGRIFDSDAPQQTTGYTPPDKFLVFQELSGIPVACQGPSRPAMAFVVAVKVVGKALPFSALAAALDRVDALLFGVDVTATVSGASWRFVVNEMAPESRAFKYVERSTGGPVYRHAGRQWPVLMMPV